MTHLRPTVSDTLLNVQVHDHVCLLYETPEEQFQTALPFLKAGLDKQDYCIYVADENTTQTVMERMRRENLDVDTAVASGRLALLTKRESFLRNGAFDRIPQRGVRAGEGSWFFRLSWDGRDDMAF